MEPTKCPYCGGELYSDAKDLIYCLQCSELYSDHHAPGLGTDGTPQMRLGTSKDENGQERITGALWLEKWRKKNVQRKRSRRTFD